ncbi:MAG: D-alanyl-D-alanine carboxypeptidase [Thermostichales cyanobacterium BF4_bins_65]
MNRFWPWLGLAAISVVTSVNPPPAPALVPAIPIPTPPPLIPTPTPTPTAGSWYQAAWSAYTYAWGDQDSLLITDPKGDLLLAAGWDQGLPTPQLAPLLRAGLLLCTWPVEHRFATHVYGLGRVEGGTFHGDIWIVGEGDPYFIWADGVEIARNLQDLGIRRITGSLVISGQFAMDGQTDAKAAGQRLQQSLASVLAQDRGVQVQVAATALPPQARRLLSHHSRPLREVLPMALGDPDFVLPELPALPATLDAQQLAALLASPQLQAIIAATAQPRPTWPLNVAVIQLDHLWIGRFGDGRTFLWQTQAPEPALGQFLQDIR